MAPMNNSPLNTLVAEEEEAVLSDSSVTPMSTPGQARMTRKVACGGRTGALLLIIAMAGTLVVFCRSHAQRPPIRVRGAVSLGEGLIVRNEYQKGCMIPFGAGTCSSELGSMMRTESMPVGLTCCQAFSFLLLQNQDCVACNPDGSDMCFGACGQKTPSPMPADVGPTRASPAPTSAATATPSPALATKNPAPAPEPAAAPTQAPAAAPTEIPTLASPTASPTPPPTTPSSRTPSPTASPTPSPTTASPTASPTPPPTTPSSRTPSPTASPTPSPTTASPTASPTPSPTTASPTASPTPSPTTASPTASPTPSPTTASPTASPTPPPTTPSSRTPSPTASPTESPTTETPTTTTCGSCQWPAGTLDHSVITHGNALINAKNIYTEMTIGGDLSSTTSENKRVGGEATVGGTYSSTGWTFEQGVTQAPFSSVFDWSDFEDLATRLEEGVYYIGDTNYYVFVRETGGEFHLFDFHDINDPSPLNQGENNGRTLVVFNTHESVTLKADPDFGRKFGPTVLAPFSTVTKDASSDFIDGILIAKEAIVPDGDTQMHGDPYRGPLKCSCG